MQKFFSLAVLLLIGMAAHAQKLVATRAIWPQRANYVVAIDGFIGREKLLRDVGCICHRRRALSAV